MCTISNTLRFFIHSTNSSTLPFFSSSLLPIMYITTATGFYFHHMLACPQTGNSIRNQTHFCHTNTYLPICPNSKRRPRTLTIMADFGWLRLGQRSHVPNSPQSPPPRRELPRVPSHPNLTSPSPLSHDSLMGHGDASLIVREHDKIWYNPSLNQMVECLQVAIMVRIKTSIGITSE